VRSGALAGARLVAQQARTVVRPTLARQPAPHGPHVLDAPPPSRRRQTTLLLLAAGLSGFTILQGISPHDEGLMLQAGARIAHGQWPYRDFWANYPPGQLLVLAALYKIFGGSLLAWRVVRVAIDATVSLLAYRLARRRVPESYALIAWLAVAGAMAFPTGPGPGPPAIALTLAALLAARRQPLAGALLAGLACLFRFEIGIAAVLGVLLEVRAGTRARVFAAAAATALATLAAFFVVAPGAMLHDTFGFYDIQGLQRLPFPLSYHGPLRPNKLLEFYIPLILVLGLAVWGLALAAQLRMAVVARRMLPSRLAGPARAVAPDLAALSIAPLGLVGLAYLLGRTDEFHLIPLAVALPIMLAIAAAAQPVRPLRFALLLALSLIALHGLDRRAGDLLHPPALAAVPGTAGDGVQTDPADARSLASLERTVAMLTRPGEPVFIANPRHDLVHAGDPLLYVLLDHPNPTRYDVMQPGVVTTASVQREIVRELSGSRTRVVVRWLDPRATLIEPNGAGRSSGVRILDHFLAARFRAYTRYGSYEVLLSK
jgi:hypothetical protein